ncbi:hypothetical protein [Rhizobium leguminosarum]|uniref:hypothetical protein n=1 Tax=Rhizobium leguminosarum TaxID=384 RepID=UPI0014421FB8|nr:hypothetical protein [Rhizobium leguminosarum]MBY5863241.1 hypothetical protein [Rhizobium leguminosarum]NKM04121.1 hypothetical protein [Rhizobium leguminosarum bv. viciae]
MSDLSELVREAWRNACENGYEQTLRAMAPESLACDLIDCCDGFDQFADENGECDELIKEIVAILPQVIQ